MLSDQIVIFTFPFLIKKAKYCILLKRINFHYFNTVSPNHRYFNTAFVRYCVFDNLTHRTQAGFSSNVGSPLRMEYFTSKGFLTITHTCARTHVRTHAYMYKHTHDTL